MDATQRDAFEQEWKALREKYDLETFSLVYIMEDSDALSFAAAINTEENPPGLSRSRICIEMIGQGVTSYIQAIAGHSGVNLQCAAAILRELVDQSKADIVRTAMQRQRAMQAAMRGPSN
tara:strand:+ start:136 stop:495 length:360 start_codon:yes stop_codon:yes gene_type:complete